MKKSILGLLLAVMITLSACGASNSSSAPEYNAAPSTSSESRSWQQPQYEREDYAAAESASADWDDGSAATRYGTGGEASGSTGRLPLVAPSNAMGSKIVYTVSMHLQTLRFEEGTRNLLNTVAQMGGYVESTHIQGRSLYYEDYERSARYQLRVPSENLADFLEAMEDNYNLVQLSQESQNITEEYVETTSRADALRDLEQSLLQAIEDTDDEDERLDLEWELAGVRSQIASLDATAGSMQNAVIYSSVSIQLDEVILPDYMYEDAEPEPFGVRLGETTSGSWGRFVAFCQGLLLLAITLLPVIVVLAVIGGVALVVVRVVRKNGKLMKKLGKTPRDDQNNSQQ